MKSRKIAPQFFLYTPIVFWVVLFIFLLFLGLDRHPLSALGIALLLMACHLVLSRMTLDSFDSRTKTAEKEKAGLQAELRYLLSLVSSEKTPSALLTLTELLRYLIYECDTPVPLHKELQAIESYIALLQLRYDDPLNISVDNEVGAADIPIEPMLLIPLLENAFKHSGIGTSPKAFIRIHLREDEGLLMGHFVNSRSPVPADTGGGGIGLQNIRKRLSLLQPYRPEENLVILESPEVFEVFIKIPGVMDVKN